MVSVVAAGIDTEANAWAAAHFRLVICVSLRMAASAEAPLYPILLQASLQARGGAGMMGEQACQRALTEKRTLCGAAAHSRLVISVFLRTAASAEAPWTSMALCSRLQGMGEGSERAGACQRALT